MQADTREAQALWHQVTNNTVRLHKWAVLCCSSHIFCLSADVTVVRVCFPMGLNQSLPSQCPVNCVTWSPLSHDVFLTCSSDWTIQLWKQDHFHPVLGLTSTQRAVYDIQWSPKWATVFGVVSEGRLEIWDLHSSMWVSLWLLSVSLSLSPLFFVSPWCETHELVWPSAWTRSLWCPPPPAWRWSPCCLPRTQTASWWETVMDESLSTSSRTSARERAAR